MMQKGLFDIPENKIDILLLIPCFNEEENIDRILKHLRDVKHNLKERSELNLEILIVNDGSTDKTIQILEKINRDSLYKIVNLRKNKDMVIAL